MKQYDFLVIGSDPAGQKAAIQAAKYGKRTAVIERWAVIGGAAVHTGTIPSKTLREAVLCLSARSTNNMRQSSLISTLPAMSSVFPASRRLRWNKAGWQPAMLLIR